MSIDAIFPKKNVGSSTSPIWEEFVYKTLANSVYMDDTFDKTLTDNIDELVNTLDNKVSKEQTINNQPLSSNITLTAENVGAISALEKGTSNGIAELDETGKVPVSQLPSYVDDVIEGYYHNGKFYQDLGYETELENNSNYTCSKLNGYDYVVNNSIKPEGTGEPEITFQKCCIRS